MATVGSVTSPPPRADGGKSTGRVAPSGGMKPGEAQTLRRDAPKVIENGLGPAGTYQGYQDSTTKRWMQQVPPKNIKGKDIVAVLGDSISDQSHPFYGWGGSKNWTWSSQLKRFLPGKTLWIAGRGGQPATGPDPLNPPPPGSDAKTLLKTLLARKPATIILQLGINDFHSQKTAAQFKASMMDHIKTIRRESPGTEIILVGVRDTYPAPSPKNKELYAKYKERVKEYIKAFNEIGDEVRKGGGVYIPDMFAGLKNNDGSLRSEFRVENYDPIHPNQKAGYLIATHVKKSMVKKS